MIRVAAVGDLHVGPDSAGALREQLSAIHDKADVLLIAGDLTKSGEPEEAEALARELQGLSVQVVAVLGNHDHHADRPAEIAGKKSDCSFPSIRLASVTVSGPPRR